MHSHDHDQAATENLRPKAARLDERVDERPDAVLLQAAAAGRSDVLGPEGMLRMQRAVGNGGTAALAEESSPVLEVISGGGEPLAEPVRADMESRLGADFSDVRVHTGDQAHESAQSVAAHAYTVGSNIVFQRDTYDPSSTAGQTMLAHELTHVIQQRSGPVDGTPTGAGVSVSDPSDRFERAAAQNAERVMSAPTPAGAVDAASAGAGTAVQREAEDEDELQMSADPSLQREETADEQLEDAPG